MFSLPWWTVNIIGLWNEKDYNVDGHRWIGYGQFWKAQLKIPSMGAFICHPDMTPKYFTLLSKSGLNIWMPLNWHSSPWSLKVLKENNCDSLEAPWLSLDIFATYLACKQLISPCFLSLCFGERSLLFLIKILCKYFSLNHVFHHKRIWVSSSKKEKLLAAFSCQGHVSACQDF